MPICDLREMQQLWCKTGPPVDDFVCESKHAGWNLKPNKFGCLDIDYKLKLSRLQNGKVCG